jgi:hypothetical protein
MLDELQWLGRITELGGGELADPETHHTHLTISLFLLFAVRHPLPTIIRSLPTFPIIHQNRQSLKEKKSQNPENHTSLGSAIQPTQSPFHLPFHTAGGGAIDPARQPASAYIWHNHEPHVSSYEDFILYLLGYRPQRPFYSQGKVDAQDMGGGYFHISFSFSFAG